MHDLQDRIRQSRPAGAQVPTLDVDQLRRRARSRQRRRTGGWTTLALALVVGVGLIVQGAARPTGVRIQEPAGGARPSGSATSVADPIRAQLVELTAQHQRHLDQLRRVTSDLATTTADDAARPLRQHRQTIAADLAQIEQRFAALLDGWHTTSSPDDAASTPPTTPLTVDELIGTATRPPAPPSWQDVQVPWVPDGFTRTDDDTFPGPPVVRTIRYVRDTTRPPQGLVVSIFEPDPHTNPGDRHVAPGATLDAVHGRSALVLSTTPSDPDTGLRTLIWEHHEDAYLTVTGRSGVTTEDLVEVANRLDIPN